ncbi:MAG: VIT1/CCC1 transporter family protein, partial [Chlamydiia bacterium]|nr:VIT1/CCC1 transporter family protein [Chlamydiia bacterium]
ELYQAKGFEGKLLEEVVDVLMADGDRLLRVMLEEELGLSLESHEHPVKQGLFAALGSFASLALALLGYLVWPPLGILMGCILAFGLSAAAPAWYSKNRIIPAVVWNLAAGSLATGLVYFILDYIG